MEILFPDFAPLFARQFKLLNIAEDRSGFFPERQIFFDTALEIGSTFSSFAVRYQIHGAGLPVFVTHKIALQRTQQFKGQIGVRRIVGQLYTI